MVVGEFLTLDLLALTSIACFPAWYRVGDGAGESCGVGPGTTPRQIMDDNDDVDNSDDEKNDDDDDDDNIDNDDVDTNDFLLVEGISFFDF